MKQVKISDLEELNMLQGEYIQIECKVIEYEVKSLRSGKPWIKMLVEDNSGQGEVSLFSNQCRNLKNINLLNKVITVTADVSKRKWGRDDELGINYISLTCEGKKYQIESDEE